MTKMAGSGSISQRHGSAVPDPDPHQNVMDLQQCFLRVFKKNSKLSRHNFILGITGNLRNYNYKILYVKNISERRRLVLAYTKYCMLKIFQTSCTCLCTCNKNIKLWHYVSETCVVRAYCTWTMDIQYTALLPQHKNFYSPSTVAKFIVREGRGITLTPE
jgi:hypothetical protein